MERNPNDGIGGFNAGSAGSTGSTGSTSGIGGSGTGGTGDSFGTSSSYGSAGTTGTTGTATTDAGSVADRARDMASTAREKLADVGSTVRDQAGTAKNSLADMLETGADKLRNRTAGATGTLAGATSTGTTTVDDGRVAQVTDRVAGGMKATADWLRDADLEGMQAAVERQVREHPGRTLLVAVGLGYLLGKALRK